MTTPASHTADRRVRRQSQESTPSESLPSRFFRGMSHYPRGFIAALLSSWTMMPLALWGAALGLTLGFLAGLINDLRLIHDMHAYGIDQGIGWVSIVGLGLAGAVLGFIIVYGGSWGSAPIALIVDCVYGVLASGIFVALYYAVESWWDIRRVGYRRLSKREAELVTPAYAEVAARIGIAHPPPVMVEDSSRAALPNAHAHLRHVVLTKAAIALLENHDEQGKAIIAHELEHVRSGHVFGLRMVWAACLPCVLAYNLAFWLTRHSRGQSGTLWGDFLGGAAYFLFWPAVVLLKYVIGPIQGYESRGHEYQCDAAAVRAGYGEGMVEVLEIFGETDVAGSGWEEVMLRQHPPIELRIERVLDALAHPPAPTPVASRRRSTAQPAAPERRTPPPPVPSVVGVAQTSARAEPAQAPSGGRRTSGDSAADPSDTPERGFKYGDKRIPMGTRRKQ